MGWDNTRVAYLLMGVGAILREGEGYFKGVGVCG